MQHIIWCITGDVYFHVFFSVYKYIFTEQNGENSRFVHFFKIYHYRSPLSLLSPLSLSQQICVYIYIYTVCCKIAVFAFNINYSLFLFLLYHPSRVHYSIILVRIYIIMIRSCVQTRRIIVTVVNLANDKDELLRNNVSRYYQNEKSAVVLKTGFRWWLSQPSAHIH